MNKKIPSSPRSGECTCYTVLDLFSGIGGFSLGLARAGGFRTVAFCEIDDFPRRILRKHWPNVPIFEDVRKLHASDLPEPVDLICGGFPCQPFSVAGERQGKDDDRHLWPEMFRLVQEIRPTWLIGENVTGLVSMGLDQVLSDLESEGYACRTFIIPACAVETDHRRDRVWLVANSEGVRLQRGDLSRSNDQSSNKGVFPEPPRIYSRIGGWGGNKSGMARVVHGLPNRVDRVKALGNAVVPQIPELIGRCIRAV